MKNMCTLLHGTSHSPSSGSMLERPINPSRRGRKWSATVTRLATRDPSAVCTATLRGPTAPDADSTADALGNMENQRNRGGTEQDHE